MKLKTHFTSRTFYQQSDKNFLISAQTLQVNASINHKHNRLEVKREREKKKESQRKRRCEEDAEIERLRKYRVHLKT